MKIKGFFQNQYSDEGNYLIMAVENLNGQLDFPTFVLYDREKNENNSYVFQQQREVVPRPEVVNDPIVKFKLMAKKD